MTDQTKAAALVANGKYKKAVILMTKAILADPENLQLYRLRFEYAQFIPFDKLYHHAASEFFEIMLIRDTSGNIIHDHYVVYLSITQGRISLHDDLLLRLSSIFAGHGFANDAVYIINRIIRNKIKPEGLVDAIMSLVLYYIDHEKQSKATQYVQYMVDFFPQHDMTKYLVRVYQQTK